MKLFKKLRAKAAGRFGRSLLRGRPSLFWAIVVTVLYGGSASGYLGLIKVVLKERRK